MRQGYGRSGSGTPMLRANASASRDPGEVAAESARRGPSARTTRAEPGAVAHKSGGTAPVACGGTVIVTEEGGVPPSSGRSSMEAATGTSPSFTSNAPGSAGMRAEEGKSTQASDAEAEPPVEPTSVPGPNTRSAPETRAPSSVKSRTAVGPASSGTA